MMPSDAERLLGALRQRLQALGSVLVCYSGGVDSALLLAVAHQTLGARAIGLLAASPSLAPAELQGALGFAARVGADCRVVESREMDDPGYVANGPDRCFYCKSELYRIAERSRVAWGVEVIVNGTNVDDLGDYRPGLEAASKAGVVSPFVDLGFGKEAIRACAHALDLPVWDKPAAACLSSRIPYGTSVTAERLSQIAGFEALLRDLGFRQLRVRYHGEVARLELGVDELPRALDDERRAALVEGGKRFGFTYVTLDLAGYRMGSHNEVLRGRSLPIAT